MKPSAFAILPLLLVSAVHGGAPMTDLLTEDFDTDGEGSRYTSSAFDDGGSDFFERLTTNPDPRHLAAFTFTAPQGGSFWGSEDIDDGMPSNPLGDHGIVRLNDLAVTGFNSLTVSVFLATTETMRFDIEDKIEIQVAVDGDSGGADLTAGTYTTIGRFLGNGPDIFASEEMKLDADLDGVVFSDPSDAASPTLDSTMREFVFNVPFTGDNLSVQVRIEQNGGSEEIAFDHIRVQGVATATDPPVLAGIEGGAVMFTEGDPATVVTSSLVVSDPDSADLVSATVRFTAGYQPSEDSLAVGSPGGLGINYDAPTGTLDLFGTASLATYQTALRSVTYANSNTANPSTAIRTLQFQARDGGNSSNFQTRNVQVTGTVATGTIPHLEDLNTDGEGVRYTSSTYRSGDDFFERSDVNPAPDHAASFAFNTPQSGGFWASEDVAGAGNPLGDHGILRLQNLDATGLSTIEVRLFLAEIAPNGEGPEDKIEIQYAFDGDIPANPTDLSSGTYSTVGRFVPNSPDQFTTGPMTLDSDLDGVVFGDPDDSSSPALSSTMTEYTFSIPATGNTLSVQVRLQQNGGSEELAFDHIQVTGSAVAGTPPTLANIEGTPLSFLEGDPDRPLTTGLTVTDPDPSEIASATVQITGNFDPSEDFLSTDGGVPAGITVGAFSPGTGTLGLTGPASPADFETALRAITYGNSDPGNPSPATRTVSIQVIDGDGNPSNTVTRQVSVVPVLPQGTVPILEEFETEGNGERYVASSFNTGASDSFLERVTANPDPRHNGTFTFTSPQGGAYWAGEDIENDANPLGDHGIIRLQDLAVTGWTNLYVSVHLGQLADKFDLEDKIEIQYALDGDSGGGDLTAGTYTTVGRFVGDTIDLFGDAPLTADTDLNGTADPGGLGLSSTMTRFTFPLPDGADLLSVQVRVEQNGASEEFAIDHFEVGGSPPLETVLNADNDGPGSLRQTLADLPPNGVVNFDPSLDGSTITLTGGQLIINKNVTIDAAGLSCGPVIDAGGSSRILRVSGSGTTLELNNLHFRGGAAGRGGAIDILSGNTVRAEDCSFTHNTATSFAGGAIYNASSVVELRRCSFVNNTSSFVGGAISSWNSAQLTATNCTFANNFAASEGGAVHNVNSSSSTLIHCTVAGNGTDGLGGGVFRASGVLTLENSIVAGNRAAADPNILGPFIDNGVNLTSGDPLLSPPSAFGGCTVTMHPLAGSPALDAVSSSVVTVDQRGIGRLDGFPDIGAVEAGPVLTVLNANDSGPGSLRQAINDASASPGTRIYFDPGVFPATIGVTSQLTVGGGRNIFIDASDIPGGVPVTSNGAGRVFICQSDSFVGMHSLTIFGGDSSSHANQAGGGIRNIAGTRLTLINSTVTGNTSPVDAGGIYSNGSGTALALFNTTVSDNTSVGNGGGIQNNGGSSLLISGSTLSGNKTDARGGAVLIGGSSRSEIVNSTISGNDAVVIGGGICPNGSSAILDLTNVTIVGNHADDQGGGIYNFGTLTLQDTIIAGNTAGAAGDDFRSTGASEVVISLGGNLIGTNESATGSFDAGLPNADGDMVGSATNPVDPLLAPLGDNGGLTLTQKPLALSPAIDLGTGNGSSGADQRGVPRISGSGGDSGAVELNGLVVDTVADENDGIATGGVSLRDAISHAAFPPVDLITFDPGVFPAGGPITLDPGKGQIGISGRDLLIDASGIGQPGVTVDGGNATRLFSLGGSSTVAMDSLTLTGGNGSGGDGGACIVGDSTLRLKRSTLTGNTALGGLGGGILMFGVAEVQVVDSLVSNNSAASLGGGLMSFSGDFTIINSTFTGNQSGPGTAVYMQGAGSLTLNHATVSGNTGGNALQNGATSTTIENSIVAGNVAGDLLNPGGTTFVGNNIIGGDPLLAPLSDYGGPTLSMPPLPSSPAFDGAVLLATTPATDQRGLVRPQGAGPDIGAVERSGLFAEAGPQLVVNSSQSLTDSVRRDDTAGDTLFFRYTVDPLSDFATEDYFAGFQLYEQGAERLGVGNPFFAAAYGAYNTSVGDVDLNSADPEPGLPYELVRSGIPRTLVFRIDFVPGGADNVSVWLEPELGLPDFAQEAELLTQFTANCTFDEVLLRHGFNGNGWTFSDMEISELSPFATPVTFAGLHPGLDPNGDENGDGLTNYHHYASGDDPVNPVLLPTLLGDLYSHPVRINGSDVFLAYEYSTDLQTFVLMMPGSQYVVDSTSSLGLNVREVTIEVLFDPLVEQRIFWRHRFDSTAP